MINKSEKINLISVLGQTSQSVFFPKSIVNNNISVDDFLQTKIEKNNAIDAVLYFCENIDFKSDACFNEIEKSFPNTPIIHVGASFTDITPKLIKGVPFISVNVSDILTEKVISMMHSMAQFKEMIRLHSVLKEDVDATKLIADLNIERLHKTLKDLELERQKTEKVNKSKQLFLAGVTHELRTPLTAIHGFADLFSYNNLNIDQKRSIKIIKEASSNLLNIVNDLLNYSKISDGKLSLYNEPFSLKISVNTVYELLKQKADEKGLDFQLNFMLKDDLRVMGDRFRLKQVLINLISNAIKFTESGSVKVFVSESLGNNFVFSVKDTGVGIKEDKLNSIFESYVQAEDDTSREYGGTGLGLAIVKELIQLQGGTISVKSQLNEGSEFSFQLSLPIVQNEPQESDLENSHNMDLSNLSVLAVEDNHLNQLLIQKLLAGKVKALQIAGDGLKAINLAQTVKFDVILMDLNLPKMSGMDVVAEIRKIGLNRTTPIAVITANVWEEELELIKKNGIETIIQKPFNRKDLYFQIYTLCNAKKGDLINLEYLKQMSGSDHLFIADVLLTYQVNIVLDMDKLVESIANGDVGQARTIAHKMKSSFKMLQMKEACEICEEIEFNEDNIISLNLIKVLKLIIDKSIIEAKELTNRFSI